MEGSALAQSLATTAPVLRGSLGQSAVTMVIVAVLSTLAIMEALAWQTGLGTCASVCRALLVGTAR
jgi:hypothetical protein